MACHSYTRPSDNTRTRLTSKKTHDSPVLGTMLNRLKKYGVDLAGSIFNADKGYDGERNFESLFGIYVLPNIKQRTNAKKGKNRKKAERYSMHQYIIIEG